MICTDPNAECVDDDDDADDEEECQCKDGFEDNDGDDNVVTCVPGNSGNNSFVSVKRLLRWF